MIQKPFRVFKAIVVSLVLICFFFQTVAPARAEFTIDDEQKVGKEIYQKLSKENILIQDERVNDYINRLGNLLLSHSRNVLFTFHFSVINSSAINAFATPGGYVYVNKGLLHLVQKESELAGVLAHEIAHVNSRHVAGQIEKSQKLTAASLAAILGAILLGGGTGSQAVMGLGMATATSMSLKFSRENEEEADRLGLSYLVGSGYDGMGMVTFLKSMKNFEFYSNSIPSYFLTHPGTNERLSYVETLLKTSYPGGGATSIVGGLKRVQTQLALGGGDPDSTLKYFQNRLSMNPDDADALYGLAVIQGKLGQTAESFNNFSRALSLAPDDVDILRDLGMAYLNKGRAADAISALRRAYALDEKDSNTILGLGRSYEAAGDFGAALEFYRKYLEGKPGDVNILYNIAMAHGETGNQGYSHYYFALYFKKKKKPESALFHLKEAQKYAATDSDLASEIQKIRKEIESPSSRAADPQTQRKGKRWEFF